MAGIIKNRSHKRGLPPGAAVYVGNYDSVETTIDVIDYDHECVRTDSSVPVADCPAMKESDSVSWIDVVGLADVKSIQAISDAFDLHPLVLEDILNTDQRPKLEEYGGYMYAVVKMLQWDSAGEKMISEQVSFILTSTCVISFQERPGDVFDHVRKRIRDGKGRIRRRGADYLLYCLLDAVVDGYFSVLEHLGDRIEILEESLTNGAGTQCLHDIHAMKRQVLMMRKSLWPLRELLGGLERSELPLIAESTQLYLRDLHDHSVQVMDTMETFREMLSGMLDIYLSIASNRMNEVMKVLTIIATIFIPLTFIAGVYGMNFKNMPELDYQWGYPAVMSVMVVVGLVMVIFFRRKKWL